MPTTFADRVHDPDRRGSKVWSTPLRALFLGWLCAFLIGAGWAVASPMSSSPDEPSHILKAEATVRGQFTGEPSKFAGRTYVEVPTDLADPGGDFTCYVFHWDVTAACVPAQSTANNDTEVERTTGVGDYNPLYYAVVGWPSLVVDGNAAWFGMRLMSALLNGFFIGILFFVAAQLKRSPAFLGWVAVALTPMTLYLTGMVNPNSAEITGAAALAALSWLVVWDTTRAHLGSRMALIAFVGIICGNARALSPLYVALILVAVLITFPLRRSADLLRRPAVYVGLGIGALGLVAAGLWTLLISGPAGFIPTDTPRDGFVRAFVQTLRTTSEYGRMMIGRLGWLDTPLPGIVYVGWTAVIGFLVVAVVIVGLRRATLGALLLMVALVFVPAVVQAPSVQTFGYIWQGRYTLPVFVAMILVAGLVAERYTLRSIDPTRIVVVLTSAAVLAQFAAWFTTYKRYAVGLPGSWRDLLHPTQWSPPGGLVGTTAVFTLGTVGMCVLSILVSRSVARQAESDGLAQWAPAGGAPSAAAPAADAPTVAAPAVGAPAAAAPVRDAGPTAPQGQVDGAGHTDLPDAGRPGHADVAAR
ncbi:hypothetical protein C1N91_10485 [Curtobacterium sp. SGAir0471]|uniref:DUF2142 domain-containing protein n=1 Tax=Curtobacterium sp. SGAir0471 TaxID=2070337 RepID=UPI0010CCF13E|nr:DUF2142 domain-containing protein [Curtobacterium sp. SGAir0471]QCR43894.1 hypothetical protein C1N91_10485 [Curtobacterium sp. SGAir0471]